MPKYQFHAVALAATVLVSVPQANAAWYDTTRYHCSDPFDTVRFLRNTNWFPNKLPLEFKSPSDGIVYADLKAAILAGKNELRQGQMILNQVELDEAKKAQLSGQMAQADSQRDIPLLLQNVPSLAGFWNSNLSATAISGIFSFLFNEIGVTRLSLASARTLLATGGTVSEVATLKYIDQKHFLTTYIRYSVRVGTEDRIVLLGACTYPARVEHVAFRTDIGVNDKLIRKEGDRWFVENLSDGDRQPGYLEQVSEDAEYLYFSGVDFSSFYDNYRIAKYGGSFEVDDDGTWVTLYETTIPE